MTIRVDFTVSGNHPITVSVTVQEPEPVTSVSQASPKAIELRLYQLDENIQKNLVLLKEYEDKLRCEDDPRRQEKCRREIKQLRRSIARYRRRYDGLRAQVNH